MPRVTVITAARNAERFLPDMLASVFDQTYRDWELVLADDASTDKTGDLAESFGEPVRVVRSEHNLGPAEARNLAARHARGELLAKIDSDDLVDPEYLATLVDLYDRETGHGAPVGVVACNARMLTDEGWQRESWTDRMGDANGVELRELLSENVIFGNALFPRAAFEEIGGFDARLLAAEEYDLWVRLLERGYRVVAAPEALAVYRIRGDSQMGDPALRAAMTARLHELALERGRLDRRQRRVARKKLRLYRLLARRANGDRRVGLLALAGRVALEHPERWGAWIRRRGPGDPGPARRP
jgi:glycosyltransferase involved in cell wall biosynthesis